MPYRLLQGGRMRRRRRRRWPALVAFAAVIAALALVLAPRTGERPHAPRAHAAPSPTDTVLDSGAAPLPGGGRRPAAVPHAGTAPLAGGGTVPSPLAVQVDGPADVVHVRFKVRPRAGLLFDLDTGRVLWRRNPTRVLPIASLTKMMTALVVVDHVPRGAKVPVTKQALAYQGSGVGLLPKGKSIAMNTMLHGLLLPSGN